MHFSKFTPSLGTCSCFERVLLSDAGPAASVAADAQVMLVDVVEGEKTVILRQDTADGYFTAGKTFK